MKRIIIAGGTGFVGTRLINQLIQNEYEIIVLTRNPENHTATNHCKYKKWDVENEIIDAADFETASAVINLTGANVAKKRWTKNRKQEIAESRIRSTKLLANTILNMPNSIEVFINASAIGWYGTDDLNTTHRYFIEEDEHCNDFFGNLCFEWESALLPLQNTKIRTVMLRTGIVLDKSGGILQKMVKPVYWGLAPVLGNGKSVMSWIHLDDLVNIYISAIENADYTGVYNAVAPTPVNNKIFITTLAQTIKGRFYTVLPLPRIILKIILGEMSSVLLQSTTVSAVKLERLGYDFRYRTIADAFNHEFKRDT